LKKILGRLPAVVGGIRYREIFQPLTFYIGRRADSPVCSMSPRREAMESAFGNGRLDNLAWVRT
jgi:hypothetical protein